PSHIPQAHRPHLTYLLPCTTLFRSCTSASLSPNPASPQAIGVTVLWSATAGGCSSPQFRFFVWNGATGWTVAQEWSTSATFSWNTRALAGRNYSHEEWACAGSWWRQ